MSAEIRRLVTQTLRKLRPPNPRALLAPALHPHPGDQSPASPTHPRARHVTLEAIHPLRGQGRGLWAPSSPFLTGALGARAGRGGSTQCLQGRGVRCTPPPSPRPCGVRRPLGRIALLRQHLMLLGPSQGPSPLSETSAPRGPADALWPRGLGGLPAPSIPVSGPQGSESPRRCHSQERGGMWWCPQTRGQTPHGPGPGSWPQRPPRLRSSDGPRGRAWGSPERDPPHGWVWEGPSHLPRPLCGKQQSSQH